MAEQKNKPVKSYKAGSVEASVWRQEVEKNGHTILRHSVCIQKQFKNKEGKWQNSNYFFPEDLPKLELVTKKAFECVSLKESEEIGEDIPV